jgi:hypothetical protein
MGARGGSILFFQAYSGIKISASTNLVRYSLVGTPRGEDRSATRKNHFQPQAEITGVQREVPKNLKVSNLEAINPSTLGRSIICAINPVTAPTF